MATTRTGVARDAMPSRVMFMYWGRYGGTTRLALELGRAALADPRLSPTISVSRQNEEYEAYLEFGEALFPVDTFKTAAGAFTQSWRIPALRRQLVTRLKRDGTEAVITLMPHVWSSFVAPAIRRAGVRYMTIVHDADVHPGDRTGLVKVLLDRDLLHADAVFTLTATVARSLADTGKVPREKLFTLFPPDLAYGPTARPNPPVPGEPLRLLFLGRIMPYKGLPLLLDAVDALTAEGIGVHLGVFGDGPLGPSAERLSKMGAEVVNRWLTATEIGSILPRFHAVVLSHIEASQSGVAATAFGSGLPVVATPVGGLIEQVRDGQNGVLARRADPSSLAEAIKHLLLHPTLYRQVCNSISSSRHTRSMARFVEECTRLALHPKPVGSKFPATLAVAPVMSAASGARPCSRL